MLASLTKKFQKSMIFNRIYSKDVLTEFLYAKFRTDIQTEIAKYINFLSV